MVAVKPALSPRILTAGVATLPYGRLVEMLRQAAEFDASAEEDNPYGERDQGTIDVGGETYSFKPEVSHSAVIFRFETTGKSVII